MFCTHCGKQIPELSNYCGFCGAHLQTNLRAKVLTRSSTDSRIAGICGGLAEYFGVDSTIVRLVWIVLSIFPGGFVGGLLAYLLAWIVIPKAPSLPKNVTQVPLEPHANATT